MDLRLKVCDKTGFGCSQLVEYGCAIREEAKIKEKIDRRVVFGIGKNKDVFVIGYGEKK